MDSSTITVTDENSNSFQFDRLGDRKPHLIINGSDATRYEVAYTTIAEASNVFKTACKLLVRFMYSNPSIDSKAIGFTPFISDKNYLDAIKLIEPFRLN